MKIADIFQFPFYRQCWRMLVLIFVAIVMAKLTMGGAGGLIVAVGVWGALTRKPAYALICFALLPFMIIMNPLAFGFGKLLGISARLGIPAMTLAMMVASAQRPGRQAIPLISLSFYVVVAIVSSINGYAPLISYMKLANFSLFVLGVYVGTKNINRHPDSLVLLRSFFFAFAMFVIVGSLVLDFVNPFAAHYVSYTWTMDRAGVAAALDVMAEQLVSTGETGFLCGVTNHSQTLGPLVSCMAGWLLCDMLFVERRFMIGHVVLLVLSPVILYMTKSRTSLLAFIVAGGIVTLYCVPKYRVGAVLKRRVRSMITAAIVLLVLGAVLLELKSRGISKWVLKYNLEQDLSVEQVTATRKGKIEDALYDYHQNPLFGMGFQVAYEHQFFDQSKLFLTAPIEKGFIPTMILGETGIVGAFAFIVFLSVFYSGCIAKRYFVTLALFSTFLAINLGEATFFSPGGTGGPEWVYALVGGFVIDMSVLVNGRQVQTLSPYWGYGRDGYFKS